MREAALEVTRDSGARHATLGPGPDGWGRRDGGGWWPPQDRRNGPAPWERRRPRGEGAPFVPPWERRTAPDEDERKAQDEIIKELERATREREERRKTPRTRSERTPPEPASGVPEGARKITPTAVRASRLLGSWWTVEVQVANGAVWWPLAGAVRESMDAAMALADNVRRGVRAVFKTGDGEMVLGPEGGTT